MSRVVVDWGTSGFRAWRLAKDSTTVIERHQAETGIMRVPEGRFATALAQEIGGWIAADTEVFLSGMITSRHGWVETPYVPVPVTPSGLAAACLRQPGPVPGSQLWFMPGVCAHDPAPDVMRGEEVQVFGAMGAETDGLLILPGTHSKWVVVKGGQIDSIFTFMTGEMFALLRDHSTIGRLISATSPDTSDEWAFLAGVVMARDSLFPSPLCDIFGLRAGALLGKFPERDVIGRLSGLLIGQELRTGFDKLADIRDQQPVRIVGAPSLSVRYRQALTAFGVVAIEGPPDATVDGVLRVAALIAATGGG